MGVPSDMTREWAVVGLVVAVLVFVATLFSPADPHTDTPSLVQAVIAAAGVFFGIWVIAPWLAWLARQVRLAVVSASGRSDRGRG